MNTAEEILRSKTFRNEIIEIRRHLHQNPDLSGCEQPTVRFLSEKLEKAGIPFEIILGGTGIVAEIKGAQEGSQGPVVALRADMDALPIDEKTGLPFASLEPGRMHACGHDAHTAILFGTARILAEMRDRLKGTVKFFFQPAEESIGGAQRMIAAGCLEEPHVDCVLGLHMAPDMETGTVGIRYGKMYAASDMIDITVHGKGAHGAHPDQGIDAILTSAAILNGIQSVISRNVAPTDPAVCSIGTIQGGNVRNQIADRVTMSGIIRTLDPAQRIAVRGRIRQVVEGTAQMMGAEAEFHVTESYGPLVNDDRVTALVEKNALRLLGNGHVIREEVPVLGCEDFSYFAAERPACFFHLGCRSPKVAPQAQAGLHNCCFTIDEECLFTGIRLQAENVLALLNCPLSA